MAIRRAQASKALEQLEARLAASETRVEELTAELTALRAEFAGVGGLVTEGHAYVDEAVERRASQLLEQIVAQETKATQDHRKHAGFIDVLRRAQKAQEQKLVDEATERRADTERIHRLLVEHATRVTEAALESSERAAGLVRLIDEARTAAVQADQATRQRLDEALDEVRQAALRQQDELSHRLGKDIAALAAATKAREEALERRFADETADLRRTLAEQRDTHEGRFAELSDRTEAHAARHAELLSRTERLEAAATLAGEREEAVRRDLEALASVVEEAAAAQDGHAAAQDARLEAQDARLDAQDARLASLDTAVAALDGTTRAIAERLDDVDSFRTALAAILDRIGASLEISHQAVEQLLARADELEAESRRHASATADALARADAARRLADEAGAQLDALRDQTAEVAERLSLAFDRLQPLATVPTTLATIDAAVQQLGDRLTATELLLHQRDELALQMERAEEFERMLAEVDPDRYASREEIEELRAALDRLLEPADHVE